MRSAKTSEVIPVRSNMQWDFALFFAVIFLCVLWKRRKLYALSFQLPGAVAFPLVGNGISFMCRSEELLNAILKLTFPYPSPARLWLGPQLMVFVSDPDQLQVLMQSSKLATKSFLYSFLEPFMGKGVFTSQGNKHKFQKKLLQPLFGPKVLEGYSRLFQKHATRFYHIFAQRVTTFWLYPNWVYKLTSYYKEQQEMAKTAANLTEEVPTYFIKSFTTNLLSSGYICVKQARIPAILQKLDGKNNKVTDPRIPSMLEAMVEMAVNNPGCLNETDIKDHMLTFVSTASTVRSQDTQSSVIAFTLMMLGKHPHVQNKVVEELVEVSGGKKSVDFNDLRRLNYMEMCLKEAMRLFPLAPFMPRDVLEDVQFGKWTLPAGCSVLFGVYHVHRNPELWERPEEFYPEHFTPEAASKRHPFAFLPFSAGPRRCIAQQYSYTNMKILLSTILLNYVVECEGSFKDMRIIMDVSIRSRDGYMIKIKNRT
ncbi:hypothetical protein NQ315_008618 [Exocentrus adspersus]|uniref:Cytochrome P450 n=1 Tax=Exocentrus adspersus TaxID=1586481 RepID=A0AAV8W761_9CUCU|nr:hypothetical protein NQ315_008618 [Exocentrus adspersus]